MPKESHNSNKRMLAEQFDSLVWGYIRTARGEKNALTASRLGDMVLPHSPNKTDAPRVRRSVRRLRLQEHRPIASCNTGYFIPRNGQERRKAKLFLTVRAQHIEDKTMKKHTVIPAPYRQAKLGFSFTRR